MDDRTIVAAQKGDRTALAILLRGLQDAWFRLCLSQLGDAERARDATQETGLRFLRQISGFRGESGLRTWSLGIAINVVRELKRSQRTLTVELDEVAAPGGRERGPHAAAEAAESQHRLRQSLARLSDRQREALTLRYLEEMSVSQTAQAMGCAEGTVKATIHQALQALRKSLRPTAKASS